MAEAQAAAGAGKGLNSLLKAKIGPVPLPIIAVAGLTLWYVLQRKSATTTAAGAVPNQQKDPAGNIGSIDPATGYVYGTPEDTAALTSNNAGVSSGGGGSTTPSGSTTAGSYTTDAAWSVAAINYLVGLGIDPTTANQAIGQFLTSQNLTPSQQGDVNLAIQGLGAPPQPPTPSQSNPSSTTTGTGPPLVAGTTPPLYAPYTLVAGDTNPSEVIMKIYGIPASDMADIATVEAEIVAANPLVGSYVPGQIILVPALTADGNLVQKSYPPGGGGMPLAQLQASYGTTSSGSGSIATPVPATKQVAPVAPRPTASVVRTTSPTITPQPSPVGVPATTAATT